MALSLSLSRSLPSFAAISVPLQQILSSQHRNGRRWYILNVGLATVDGVDLARVQIDAGDTVAGIGKGDSQRQPYVAEPDDGHVRVTAIEFLDYGIYGGHGFSSLYCYLNDAGHTSHGSARMGASTASKTRQWSFLAYTTPTRRAIYGHSERDYFMVGPKTVSQRAAQLSWSCRCLLQPAPHGEINPRVLSKSALWLISCTLPL